MSLLVLFSRRFCDLGAPAVWAGRWLGKAEPEAVENLSKRASKGKRKAAKGKKLELIKKAVERAKLPEFQLEAPSVNTDELEKAKKAFELMQNYIKHLYTEKAAKEHKAELERMKAELKRQRFLEDLENELLALILSD